MLHLRCGLRCRGGHGDHTKKAPEIFDPFGAGDFAARFSGEVLCSDNFVVGGIEEALFTSVGHLREIVEGYYRAGWLVVLVEILV